METQQFFTGTNRRIILGSPQLQASTRRICVGVRMPLSGESVIGMPEWLGDAYTAVSRFASDMTPEIEQIADITLAFQNSKPPDGLFETPSARVPQAELRAFHVVRAGEADAPDVELTFKIYTPFTRDFWGWIGELAGKEVYMAFPKSLGGIVQAVKPEQPSLLSDSEVTDVESDAFGGDSNPDEDGEGPGSAQFEEEVRQSLGAPEPLSEAPRLVRHDDPEKPCKNRQELAAYHASQTEKESRPRGRRGARVN